MLKALSKKLQELAKNTEDEFKDIIKEQLDGKVTEEQISSLKEFIFLLPPTLQTLNSYWDDSRIPLEVKKLSGLLIAYVVRRDDFISDEKLGLFGYLDDSYFVVSAFLKIQDMYLRDWQDKSREEMELTDRARKLIIAPKIVIPEETRKIDEIINLFSEGKITNFEEYLWSR